MLYSVTYQSHNISNRPFNMKSFNALDSERAALGAKSWELDVSAVSFHNLTDFVESGEKDAINLGR